MQTGEYLRHASRQLRLLSEPVVTRAHRRRCLLASSPTSRLDAFVYLVDLFVFVRRLLILPTPIMEQNSAIGPVTVGEDEKAAAAASVAADADSARMPPPPFTRRLTRPKAAPEALKGLVWTSSLRRSQRHSLPRRNTGGRTSIGLDSAFNEKPPGMSRTRSGTRAPAPPPIFLRKSDDISPRTAADDQLPSPEGPGSAGASEELASEATTMCQRWL